MDKRKTFHKQKESLPGDEYKMNPQPEIIRENYKGSEKLKGEITFITGQFIHINGGEIVGG